MEGSPLSTTPEQPQICVIEPDFAVCDSVSGLFDLLGLPCQTFASTGQFKGRWPLPEPAIVLCAAGARGSEGIDLFHWLRAQANPSPFALTLSRHEYSLQRDAAAAGIEHIFYKPLLQSGELLRFVAPGLPVILEDDR
ncbi:MAG: hypothetical protein AAGI15_14320 [Pseudomonadota bacterium]